jgi:polyhydroxyalkanoate synthesis regulator protein
MKVVVSGYLSQNVCILPAYLEESISVYSQNVSKVRTNVRITHKYWDTPLPRHQAMKAKGDLKAKPHALSASARP